MFRQLFLGTAWLLHSLWNVKCREVAPLQQEWKQEAHRLHEMIVDQRFRSLAGNANEKIDDLLLRGLYIKAAICFCT